jgi:hypothetical protein
VPEGIENLKTTVMLSNNPREIEQLGGRFFGYMFKSMNAKKLRKELENDGK